MSTPGQVLSQCDYACLFICIDPCWLLLSQTERPSRVELAPRSIGVIVCHICQLLR